MHKTNFDKIAMTMYKPEAFVVDHFWSLEANANYNDCVKWIINLFDRK
jgi:hypothetical protein